MREVSNLPTAIQINPHNDNIVFLKHELSTMRDSTMSYTQIQVALLGNE